LFSHSTALAHLLPIHCTRKPANAPAHRHSALSRRPTVLPLGRKCARN